MTGQAYEEADCSKALPSLSRSRLPNRLVVGVVPLCAKTKGQLESEKAMLFIAVTVEASFLQNLFAEISWLVIITMDNCQEFNCQWGEQLA